ncbi:hypothetical protein GB937_009288 [Aspergillus fischeri]|nr:hypothetical protein GB937_009288 [Aspergillus fischeri]
MEGITADVILKTNSELAQDRTDAKNAAIRRPGAKVNVMSDEEWKRRVKVAEENRKKREEAEKDEKLRQYYKKQREEDLQRQLKQYVTSLARNSKRDQKHQELYRQILREALDLEELGEDELQVWEHASKTMSYFMAKLDIAHDWWTHPKEQMAGLEERFKHAGLPTSRKDADYWYDFPNFSDRLTMALKEHQQLVTKFGNVTYKISNPPANEWVIYSLGAVPHLVDDNKPKNIEEWKKLMKDALDNKKHPKAPTMDSELAEVLNNHIKDWEEAKAVRDLAEHPEIDAWFPLVNFRGFLIKELQGDDEIKLLIEDIALAD